MNCIHCNLHKDNYDKKWLKHAYEVAKTKIDQTSAKELERILNCEKHKFVSSKLSIII